MKWLKQSDVVYAPKSNIVNIDLNDISMLKAQVKASRDKRVRICAHHYTSDKLHEMVILIERGSYIRPHKHLDKTESFHVIEGILDVILFDELGNITDIIQMGDFHSGNSFYYRLALSVFHTVVVKSDFVVFHETTNGPFQKEATIYSPWSPVQEDLSAVENYLTRLVLQVNEYQLLCSQSLSQAI